MFSINSPIWYIVPRSTNPKLWFYVAIDGSGVLLRQACRVISRPLGLSRKCDPFYCDKKPLGIPTGGKFVPTGWLRCNLSMRQTTVISSAAAAVKSCSNCEGTLGPSFPLPTAAPMPSGFKGFPHEHYVISPLSFWLVPAPGLTTLNFVHLTIPHEPCRPNIIPIRFENVIVSKLRVSPNPAVNSTRAANSQTVNQ